MAPSTNLGAATPIIQGDNTPEKDMTTLDHKRVSDAAAYIRGLAELRGRNDDWAEKSVTQADSLTAGPAPRVAA